MVNVIAAPAEKPPTKVIVTVRTWPTIAAVAVGVADGAVNVTTGEVRVTVPTSVMMTLPPDGVAVAGVSVTDMVTDADPATALLRVMAG